MQSEKETIFDYYVSSDLTWKSWEADKWVPPKRLAYS